MPTPKRSVSFWLIAIFTLAMFLRLFRLGSLPSGFHVDEVKVGWNAYSLLKTGHDDWEHAFPLYYDTFGDFRPTGFLYAAVPAISLLGLNEFAVRFTPAIFGALSVLVLFFLAQELFQKPDISLFSAFFLAVSPWHIALSRASSEAVISLTLTLIGLTLCIKAVKTRQLSTLLFSALFLTLSYFFYHIFRLLTPPLILITCLYYSRPLSLKKLYRPSFIVLFLLSVLTLLFLYDPHARGRFSQVSIFNDLTVRYELDKLPFEEGQNHVFTARFFHNKLVLYSTRFLTEYTRYFSSDFLIGSWGSKPLRYATVDNGPLLYIELFLVLFGLVSFARYKTNPLPLLFLLLAPVAAALTTEDTPNLNRAVFMSPLFSLFAGFGFNYLKTVSPRLRNLGLVLLVLNFVYFWHMYAVHNSGREEIAMNRNSGVSELIRRLPELQKKYSVVILTNIPDSLYPWYAFYLHLDPAQFNALAKNRANGVWQYQNLVFSEFKCPTDNLSAASASAAIVNPEGCTDKLPFKKLAEIKRTSQGIAYTIWGTN